MSLEKQFRDFILKNNNYNVQKFISTKLREIDSYNKNNIYSSVLVIIHFNKNIPHLLFTKRSSLLKNHAGEISFPGGKFDPNNDESIVDTALRETKEEINLVIEKDNVIGILAPVHTYTTKILIFPFIVICGNLPNSIKPNVEVDKIISIPLYKLQESLKLDEKFSTKSNPMFHFDFDGVYIWGATARIIKELLDVISTI